MQPADLAAQNRRQRPSRALAGAIQLIHEAIAHEPDPEDKAELTKALQVCLNIQKDMAAEPDDRAAAGRKP